MYCWSWAPSHGLGPKLHQSLIGYFHMLWTTIAPAHLAGTKKYVSKVLWMFLCSSHSTGSLTRLLKIAHLVSISSITRSPARVTSRIQEVSTALGFHTCLQSHTIKTLFSCTLFLYTILLYDLLIPVLWAFSTTIKFILFSCLRKIHPLHLLIPDFYSFPILTGFMYCSLSHHLINGLYPLLSVYTSYLSSWV